MGILTNSETADEMPPVLHCLLRQNLSSEKEIQYFFEIITCIPSIYIMDHPVFILCSCMESSIELKRVKLELVHLTFP